MQAILKLGAIPELGPMRTRRLLTHVQALGVSLDQLATMNAADLAQIGFARDHAHAFAHSDTSDLARRMDDTGVRVVTMLDESIPERLRRSTVAPWYFYAGNLSVLDAGAVGFSGSRDASPDALGVTRQIAGASADRGWTVISGGARGVDIAAHVAALDHGGSTVILLPQGIATWRMPPELRRDNVLVLSEFQPFDDWGSYRAMQRNKSIVHLSDWLVIPQAGVGGGTRNAGEYALKQHQPTWVVDMGPEYDGNNALIKLGATPLAWCNEASDLDQLLTRENPLRHSQSTLF